MRALSKSVVAPRARQLVDAPGFTYNGTRYEGFVDRPELPPEVRTQVARWAARSGTASAEQRSLAEERVAADVQPDELLVLLDRESRLLEDDRFSNALGHLSARERARLLRPHAVLRRDVVWPLSVREAATVLSDVTENQLRDWDNAGVCRAARWGRGRYRGYFRSHLLLAVLVHKLLKQGYRLDRVREELGIRPRPVEADDLVAVATALTDEPAIAS